MLKVLAGAGLAHEDGLEGTAAPDDVVAGYRLLLGREPAAADVASRTGHPLDGFVRSLLESPEHHTFVRAPLLSGGPFASDRYSAPPDAGAAGWLERLTGQIVSGDDRTSWRSLLRFTRICIGIQPPPRDTVTTPAPDAQPKVAATREDVQRLYQTVLGRDVESDVSVTARLGRPVADVAIELFTSDEFRVVVVAQVIAAQLSGDEDALPISDLHWARTRFGLDLPPYARRSDALAGLVEAPALARILAYLPLAWSPVALVEFIRAQSALDVEEAARPPAIEVVQRLCRNVELVQLDDIKCAPGGLRFTSHDPKVMFRLTPQVTSGAAAAELTFALGGVRRRAAGVLYLKFFVREFGL